MHSLKQVRMEQVNNAPTHELFHATEPFLRSKYEGNSKISLHSAGKKKRVVKAPKPKLSSNK
jgi:hypothetical protein